MKKNIYFFLKEVKNLTRLFYLYFKDFIRFQKNYNLVEEKADEDQILSKLILHAHGIEKGLSHENFRPGFGKEKLIQISSLINEYKRKRYNENKTGYKIILSSLKHYQLYHEKLNYNLVFFEDILGKSILKELEEVDGKYSGTVTTTKKEKENNKNLDFKSLALNRHSIREFSEEDVTDSKIESAIEIAVKTPSVCNRQPSRVYKVTDSDKIKKILFYQEGFGGFSLPPVLLTITSSTKNFVSIFERNEPFVDGGLFSMSLIYGIEYEGLACCALNAMLPPKNELEIRKILDIPSDEVIIMFLAVGNVPKSVKSPKSYRKNIEEIVIRC